MKSERGRQETSHETAFDDEQFQLAYPKGMEHHYWHLARNRVVEKWIRKFGLDAGPILEIGCGRGIVVRHLRQAGIDCFGAELADAEPIPGVGDHVRMGGRAQDLEPELRESFTSIALLDVIEHVEEPGVFLREILEAFPRVTRILVSVPARSELWAYYDEYYGHYLRYDIPQFRKLAEKVPLKIEGMSYFFRLLYPPLLLLKLLKFQRNTEFSPPQGFGKQLHHLVAGLNYLDFLLLPGILAGSSLMGCFTVPDRISASGSGH